MDEAAVRKRCEEIAKGWTLTGPGGNYVDYLYYLYRAAYADGMEEAAELLDMDCSGDVGAVIEDDSSKTAHNQEMVRLATIIRQAATAARGE